MQVDLWVQLVTDAILRSSLEDYLPVHVEVVDGVPVTQPFRCADHWLPAPARRVAPRAAGARPGLSRVDPRQLPVLQSPLPATRNVPRRRRVRALRSRGQRPFARGPRGAGDRPRRAAHHQLPGAGSSRIRLVASAVGPSRALRAAAPCPPPKAGSRAPALAEPRAAWSDPGERLSVAVAKSGSPRATRGCSHGPREATVPASRCPRELLSRATSEPVRLSWK